jgi:hypothetical protein
MFNCQRKTVFFYNIWFRKVIHCYLCIQSIENAAKFVSPISSLRIAVQKGHRIGFNEAIVEEKAFQLVGLLGWHLKRVFVCSIHRPIPSIHRRGTPA